MSTHIGAKKGEIADRILLPGDPLRAKFIAENFLESPRQFNNIRGMLGYTGLYRGARVSVMGTGMGMPSISLYAYELIRYYDVKKLIRIGTAGALNEKVHIRDLILAQGAATTSRIIQKDWPNLDFPPIADFNLLYKAYQIASERKCQVHVGNVLSVDLLHSDFIQENLKLGQYGVLAVEMETAALYYLGAKLGVETLSILTVSDSLVSQETTSAEERQTSFLEMMSVGFEAIISE